MIAPDFRNTGDKVTEPYSYTTNTTDYLIVTNFIFPTRIHFPEISKSIWGKPSSVLLCAASC